MLTITLDILLVSRCFAIDISTYVILTSHPEICHTSSTFNDCIPNTIFNNILLEDLDTKQYRQQFQPRISTLST